LSTVAATSTTGTSSVRTLEELNNTRSANKSLGKDEFLNILVMQLSNQNPLEPSSDTDFIAQLAQFSSLEQMQALNSGFTTSQAYSLVGKYVYVSKGTDGQDAETIFGKVDGVIKQDGIDYLIVGDQKYELSDVSGILDSTDEQGSLDEKILQSANLIGKTVSATYTNDLGTEETITGVVSKVSIKNGDIYATVGGKETLLTNIKEINSTT